MNDYKKLISSVDNKYKQVPVCETSLNAIRESIQDEDYFNFLINGVNGGFFFGNSLQIYSVGDVNEFNDIGVVNQYIKINYSDMLQNEFFFAQDIFGNQFGFSTRDIVFFNIETGEKEYIAKGFCDWIDLILNDLEYYLGTKIIEKWNSKTTNISYNERLCPTIPFVMGGEYEVENLYASPFPSYILANANIANQINNLPDGTNIEINPTD